MSYDFYTKQPMQMVELKTNMILDNNPRLIIALDGRVNRPLIRKYSKILFPIYNYFSSWNDFSYHKWNIVFQFFIYCFNLFILFSCFFIGFLDIVFV